MSAERLYVCGRIWWSWMNCMSSQNFPVTPPCTWLCVTLFWPPGTGTAWYTADICQNVFCACDIFVLLKIFRAEGSLNNNNNLLNMFPYFWRRCWLPRNVLCTSSSGGWCVCAVCRRWTGCFTSWPGRVSSTLVFWRWSDLCSLKASARCVFPYHDSSQQLRWLHYSCGHTLQKTHFVIFAEESHCHRCRGCRVGCGTAAAELWHTGQFPFQPFPVTVLSVPTLRFHWFTGGGAWGEGQNWRPRVGRYFSGSHCRSRSSNCQWLCEQPHCAHVWAGKNYEVLGLPSVWLPVFSCISC